MVSTSRRRRQGRPAVVLHVHLYLKWNRKKPRSFPSAALGRPFGRVMECWNNGLMDAGVHGFDRALG
jgi:hypothetical protein